METSVIAGYVATFVMALIVGMLLDRWRVQPKVVWYLAPAHKFVLEGDPPVPVNTETLYIQNLGRVAAKDVQVVFLFDPKNINVQPRSNYQVSTTQEGHHVMTFSSLGPKETIGIQVLYYEAVPEILHVRSAAGLAKNIPVWMVRRFPELFYWVMGGVAIIGLVVIAVTVIRLVVIAWEKLPT